MRWPAAIAVVALIAVAAVLGGRRVSSPAPMKPPRAVALTTAGARFLHAAPVKLAQDSPTRHAEELTLRVRNVSCQGVAVGSGWAIDPHTLITNRHVLAGAAILEADSWDGREIELNVANAKEGRLVDIGIATVSQALPTVGKTGPAPKQGDEITAVGYPLGGKLTLSHGKVIRYLDGSTLDPSIAFDGQVMQLSARVKHGNSGGPVLDAQGRVVAIIYAGQFDPGQDYSQVAYALPLGSVNQLLSTGGTQAVLPCEQ